MPPGLDNRAPGLKTFMFNGAAADAGADRADAVLRHARRRRYHETLSTEPNDDETNFGTNIGGGAKITLVGPLRLRIDYRIFNLRGTPRQAHPQRLYAGLNLKF